MIVSLTAGTDFARLLREHWPTIASVGLALSSVLVASIGQILMKKEANQEHKSFWARYLNFRVIFAYVLMVVSLFLNAMALRGLPLSVLPCITSTGFIWIIFLSAIFFREKPTKKKVIGALLIVLGIIVSRV